MFVALGDREERLACFKPPVTLRASVRGKICRQIAVWNAPFRVRLSADKEHGNSGRFRSRLLYDSCDDLPVFHRRITRWGTFAYLTPTRSMTTPGSTAVIVAVFAPDGIGTSTRMKLSWTATARTESFSPMLESLRGTSTYFASPSSNDTFTPSLSPGQSAKSGRN